MPRVAVVFPPPLRGRAREGGKRQTLCLRLTPLPAPAALPKAPARQLNNVRAGRSRFALASAEASDLPRKGGGESKCGAAR